MDRWVAVAAMVAAGGLVAMQAPINSTLGKSVGTFAAASISFAVGLAVLVCITLLFTDGFGNATSAADLRWYYLTGGLLGAAYVTTVLVSVRTLGVGGVTAPTHARPHTLPGIIDRVGGRGVDKQGLTPQRILGIALLAVGTFLVVRGK